MSFQPNPGPFAVPSEASGIDRAGIPDRGDAAVEDVLVVEHHGQITGDVPRHAGGDAGRNVEAAAFGEQAPILVEVRHPHRRLPG